MREKRRHFRERLIKPIQVHLASQGDGSESVETIEAIVVDLSLSGAMLNSPVAVSPAAQIELELPLENSASARVQAEVIRCSKREGEQDFAYAIAVRFSRELPEAAVILARNILFTYKSVIHSHMN